MSTVRFTTFALLAATLTVAAVAEPQRAAGTPQNTSAYGITVTGPPNATLDATLAGLIHSDSGILDGWEITTVADAEDANLLGVTLTEPRRIVIYTSNHTDRSTLQMTVAHEIAHAIDLECFDDTQHQQWLATRDTDTTWWADQANDFAAGAGDLAETYAAWQTANVSYSELSDGDDTVQQNMLADWIGACAQTHRRS